MPTAFQRSMAIEAETERNSRAKVIYDKVTIECFCFLFPSFFKEGKVFFYCFANVHHLNVLATKIINHVLYSKIIAAEGEKMSSYANLEAGEILASTEMGMTLRLLQNLTTSNGDNTDTTILFAIPLPMFSLHC